MERTPLNFSESKELDFDFPIEQTPLQTADTPPAVNKRKYDRTLYSRGAAISAGLEKSLQKNIEQQIQLLPEAPKGVTFRVKVVPIVKCTPGAWKVLRALIDLVLSQRGAKMTQTACREDVQAQFPEFTVCKDWTKALPEWALAHAKKCVSTSAPPVSTLKFRKGSTLSDLHKAAKVACSKTSEDALTVKASVTVTHDAVLINGQLCQPMRITPALQKNWIPANSIRGSGQNCLPKQMVMKTGRGLGT